MTIINRLITSRWLLVSTFFQAIGFLWLLIEVLDWFLNIKTNFIAHHPIRWFTALVITAIIYSVWKNWPKNYFEYKLRNKDVYIWIKIGDIFESEWSIIVPVNNKFDVSQNWHTLKAKSILNTLIEKFYDWKPQHLQQDINDRIVNKMDCYNMWETVEVTQKEKKFYLVANSKVNGNGRSQSTKDDFSKTVALFLNHLSTNADRDEVINMPILNSWHWRIADFDRTTIIKEIIYFFIEEIKNKAICDKFIIHIFPNDIKKWWIDIENLRKFFEYNAVNYRDINYSPTPEWIAIE